MTNQTLNTTYQGSNTAYQKSYTPYQESNSVYQTLNTFNESTIQAANQTFPQQNLSPPTLSNQTTVNSPSFSNQITPDNQNQSAKSNIASVFSSFTNILNFKPNIQEPEPIVQSSIEHLISPGDYTPEPVPLFSPQSLNLKATIPSTPHNNQGSSNSYRRLGNKRPVYAPIPHLNTSSISQTPKQGLEIGNQSVSNQGALNQNISNHFKPNQLQQSIPKQEVSDINIPIQSITNTSIQLAQNQRNFNTYQNSLNQSAPNQGGDFNYFQSLQPQDPILNITENNFTQFSSGINSAHLSATSGFSPIMASLPINDLPTDSDNLLANQDGRNSSPSLRDSVLLGVISLFPLSYYLHIEHFNFRT